MRILLGTIRDPSQVGGTATHLAMLERGLRTLGHDAVILYAGEVLPSWAHLLGIKAPAAVLNSLRQGWGMLYSAETRSCLLAHITRRLVGKTNGKTGGFDVINVQEVYAVPYLHKWCRRIGLPLVLTLHGYPYFESVSEGYCLESVLAQHYLMRAELRAFRLADVIVTVDSRLYRHVLRIAPEKGESTFTLMNFVDTSVFAPLDESSDEEQRCQLRDKWQIPYDKIVLLCPRRLVRKNGVIYPSLALASMSRDLRDRFLLLYAGEGGERVQIEKLVAEFGLGGHVRLLGNQDRASLLELYRLCDIVLVPSVHSENVEEATSLSALEAMAIGRPLIAGNVGGLAEIVKQRETGLLVEAEKPEQLAEAIVMLANNPELRKQLCISARQYVEANHSHVAAAQRFVELYQHARNKAQMASFRAQALHDISATLPAKEVTANTARAGSMSWVRVSVLGLRLDVIDLHEASAWIFEQLKNPHVKRSLTVVSFNPEIVMKAHQDPRAAEALLESDLACPDGVGAVWAARYQGAQDIARVPGIELAEDVLRRIAAHNLAIQTSFPEPGDQEISVFFLGAAPGVASRAALALTHKLPGLRVAGVHHGYFSADEEKEVVDEIRGSGAQLLLVALGAPKQEIFMHKHRWNLGVRVAMGVGGSFDVWAGQVRRAPKWVQQAGLEWLYRLLSEPRRARRQVVLPRFAVEVLRGCRDDYYQQRRSRSEVSD